MTLFRKVFQNQARPANDEETLSDEAMRAAFNEMDGPRTLLVLDPFAHAAGGDNAGGSQIDAREDGREEDAVVGSDPISVVGQVTDVDSFDLGVPVAEVAKDADCALQELSNREARNAPSDEDIAASLENALASEPAQPDRVQADASDTVCARKDMQSADDELSEAMNEIAQVEQAASAMAPVEKLSDGLDAAGFARRQMAALNAVEEVPQEPQEPQEPQPLAQSDSATLDLSQRHGLDAVPAPAAGRAGRRAGRVKTRLLGFNRADAAAGDPFGIAVEATATAQREKFPVGWLVIVEGPGVGHAFSIFTGASMIGRGEDQVIRLDFGDNSISRNNHAAVAYDEEQNKFYIGHGGKSNIIRRNARPVLSTEELHHADLLRIGETTLRFVALCGSDFQWQASEMAHAGDV